MCMYECIRKYVYINVYICIHIYVYIHMFHRFLKDFRFLVKHRHHSFSEVSGPVFACRNPYDRLELAFGPVDLGNADVMRVQR